MEIKKKDGNVILSKLKSDELFAFLKMQIPAQIIFVNSLGNQAKQYFDLIDRLYINSEKIIEADLDGVSNYYEYSELINEISKFTVNHTIEIHIPLNIFKEKEPLIMLISSLKKEVINACVYIDYDSKNNIFEVVNVPFKNGDSDKLYYFEMNDTILGFSENGPILITDSVNVNSIQDVICN